MNLHKLFTYKYLFQIDRVIVSRSDKLLFLIGAILIILSLVFKFASIYAPSPIDKKYRQKFFNLLLTVGLLEAVWYGARVQFVPFFGSHFFALLILLVGMFWLVWLAVKMIKNYGNEKQVWGKEQLKLKYLPK